MEITKICALFLISPLIQVCTSTKQIEELQDPLTITRQNEHNDSLNQDVTPVRVKRQFGYGYDPYYYRRYPLPIPIIIGGGLYGGAGYGFGGRGYGGRGYGGRGFGGRGFGGRGNGGRGGGGRGGGGRGGGGRGGGGGGHGGRG